MDDDIKELSLVGCVVAVLGFFICGICFGGCYGCSKVLTSDGYRDSTVRKVSESGYFWKTTEVETLGDGVRMNEGRISPETFRYSVSDPAVTEKLKTLPPGKRVRIHYRRMGAAWEPNGESPYFITRVEELP